MKKIFSVFIILLLCSTISFSQEANAPRGALAQTPMFGQEPDNSQKTGTVSAPAKSGFVDNNGIPFATTYSPKTTMEPSREVAPDALLHCDFKQGIPSNWDNWDLDGFMVNPDVFGEELKSDWIPYTFSLVRAAAVSVSYFDESSGQANDWLVTPAVTIPSDGESYSVTWDAISVHAGYLESYEVRIIENDTYTSLIGQWANPLADKNGFSEALSNASTRKLFINPENPYWESRSIDLNSYKGKSIRIIWRNTTTDQYAIALSSVLIDKERPVSDFYETFTGLSLPEGWTSDHWDLWKAWVYNTVNGNMIMDGRYMWFDAYGYDNVEGFLESPSLTPSEKHFILSYDLQQVLIEDSWPESGALLFVEVSTDDGLNYIPSYDNVLRKLDGYNERTTEIVTMHLSLEEYIGREIKVRFRAVSDWGAYVVALDNVRLSAAPDFVNAAVKTDPFLYTKTPYRHADFYPFVKIINYGLTIDSEDALMKIETNSSYNVNQQLPPIKTYETTVIEAPLFVSEANYRGKLNFKYSIVVPEDEDLSDNTVEYSTEITDNIFAVDNGELHPTRGLGWTNGEKASFGNKYSLIKKDKITAIELSFHETKDIPYSLSILNINNAEIIYTSETLRKPQGYKRGDIIKHVLKEPLSVSAGDYCLLIDQFGDWVGIAVDTNEEGSFYLLSPFEAFPNKIYEFGGANIILRAILSSDEIDLLSYTPASNEKNVPLNATIAATFSKEITLAQTTGITINNQEVAPENVITNGNKLIIKHELLEPETKHTVYIPANTVLNYEKAITWFFTTGTDIVSIKEIEHQSKVYPTLSNGLITIEPVSTAEVKIYDLSGRHLDSFRVTGREQIALNYENGIYLVVVSNPAGTTTHKVILRK